MKNIEKNWLSKIRRFLIAQTTSLFGSSIVQYSIIWYITLNTSSGVMLTLSTLCGFVPQILISLFAGVWVDRYPRKKLIMISDGLIACATFILALTFLSGVKNYFLLFVVLVVRSFGTGIQTPAVHAIIPQIVPKENLMKINGINSTISSIMMFLSPAISGFILSIAGFEFTLFIDVITAIIGIMITSTIAIPYVKNESHSNTFIEEIKAGFHYLKEHGFIKKILIYQIIILFLISPSAFLTPLMVSRTFGNEVWRLTASEMTYSLGMVLGGVLITSWGGFKKKLTTTMIAGMLYGVIMIGLGVAPIFIIYLCCNTLIGMTSPCYNAPITVTIQEKVDEKMHGRIFSFMQIATTCALPLGMSLFGPLADYMSVSLLLILSGLLVVLVSLYTYINAKKW